MSVESLARALHFPNVTPAERLVLIGIANHDGDGGAWPSIATLARYACVQPRAVQKTLGRLVARGFVTVHPNAGGTADTRSDRRPNRYTLHLTQPVDNTASRGVAEDTPNTPRGVLQDQNGVSSRTPEPSLEPSINSVPTCSRCDGTGWEYQEADRTVRRCDHTPIERHLEVVS